MLSSQFTGCLLFSVDVYYDDGLFCCIGIQDERWLLVWFERKNKWFTQKEVCKLMSFKMNDLTKMEHVKVHRVCNWKKGLQIMNFVVDATLLIWKDQHNLSYVGKGAKLFIDEALCSFFHWENFLAQSDTMVLFVCLEVNMFAVVCFFILCRDGQ